MRYIKAFLIYISSLMQRIGRKLRSLFTGAQGQERYGRLAINTAALTVGKLGSKLLVFLLVRFYTEILTDAQFGTADLITNLANLLIPIACAGLSSGFFRFVAEVRGQGDSRRVFNSGLAVLMLFSLGFVLFSPLLFLSHYFSGYVWLVILYVLSANVHYFCSEYVRGQGKYTLFAGQGILNTALNIIFNLLLLLPPLSFGVEGYVLSVVLANLGTTTFLVVREKLWREIKPGAADRRTVRDMLRFCLPLIPATICWWVTSVSDRYMVTLFCGTAVNGLYTAAYKIPNLLTICGGIFIEAWQFSAVVENRKRNQEESQQQRELRLRKVSNFFSRVYRGYAGLLFLGGGAMILFSQLFAKILFSASFYAAWVYIPVLLAATVFSAISNFAGSVYLVEKKSSLSLLTAAIGALLNVVLNLLLIPSLGAMGAAIATLISYFIVMLLRMVNVVRYIPFRRQPTRLGINVVLIVLEALVISPILRNLPVGIFLFLLIVLNNILPLVRSVRQWLEQRGKIPKKS